MASTKLTQDPEHHEMPDKTVAWYMEDADVPDLEPGACELLMRYSHLAQSEIRPHVLKIVRCLSLSLSLSLFLSPLLSPVFLSLSLESDADLPDLTFSLHLSSRFG